MQRRSVLIAAIGSAAVLLGSSFAYAAAGDGTAPEAKAMLEKAIAALKGNQAEALAKFPKPDGGFRDRDLYVYCFDTGSGKFTAHVNPVLMGAGPAA